ncbi:MAG: hypothetical protein WBC59_07320 [Phycisphaerae bacterium]
MAEPTWHIEPLAHEHLDGVARVHVQCFPGYFLTNLGERFLRHFYQGFIDSDLALGLRGMRVVSYLLESDDAHPAVCFDYVCKDPEYDVEHLSSHTRRDIRRDLRRFTARLCTWDELAEKGYDVHADTFQRHGYAAPPPGGIRQYADERRGTPFFDIWGAWEGDELVA